jgi:hypothetical protein
MTRPLSLTDRQMRLVQNAAKAVPVDRRDEFLQRLAKHLTPEPSDAAVVAALNAQLDALANLATATVVTGIGVRRNLDAGL